MQYCMLYRVCDLGPGVHGGPTRHDGTHGRVGPQSEVGLVVAEALPAAAATQVPSGCHTQGAFVSAFVRATCATSWPRKRLSCNPSGYRFLFFFFLRPCKTDVSGWSWKTGRGKRALHVGFVGF